MKKIIDIRLSNSTQLAGFAKGNDLKYFAKAIANIDYEHNIDFAPTEELFHDYRHKKISWKQLEDGFLKVLEDRKIEENIDLNKLDGACLLCSENKPDQCHRRLVAEYLQKYDKSIEIIHLL